MNKKYKLYKKITSFIMAFITIITTIFTTQVLVYASELDMSEGTGFNYVGISPITNKKVNHKIYRMKIDGKYVFCIEPGIITSSGEGYVSEEYIDSKKEILSKIAYYGYTDTDQTKYDYAVTQIMIWEELGDEFISTTVPEYHKRKNEVIEKVNRHNILPSWNNEEITIKSGETIIVDDKNNIIGEMKFESNNTGTDILLEGNKLKITANKESKDGIISYGKITQNEVGASIVYRKQNHQSLAEFNMESSMSAKLNINVIKLGSIKVKKIDEDTGEALANATIKFEYDGNTKEIITDSNGVASIEDIPEGTNVIISEVVAPNGYFNKCEIKEVVIQSNKTIEVVLGNKEQLGNVVINKVGNEFGTNMPNEYYKLEGAIYGIYDENDEKVTTMTTDEFGKAISENIKLGKYYAIEEKAPEGYLINKERIPFELKYVGQTVEVASVYINHKDVEQKGIAVLIKEDEKIGSTPQGSAELDGAIYELRKANNDELVETVIIKDGKAKVENLYLDNYYWIEKEAPEGYLLDTTKHYFEISYAGENVETAVNEIVVKEKVITGGFELIKFGEYNWKEKIKNNFNDIDNDTKYLKDVEFSVFSDTTGKLITKGLTDKKGYLKFEELPYDTYTVKETKTPEGYIAAKDFKVTIEKQDEIHHLEVKNELIKGGAKLIKTDIVTGEPLPNTGIRILDEDKNIIVEGRTDERGEFYFDNLPKGIYYFQEYEAPKGYQIDETPIRFEIKKNGEIVTCKMTNKKIEKVSMPKTGDTNNIILYGVGGLVSGILLLKMRRKKDK